MLVYLILFEILRDLFSPEDCYNNTAAAVSLERTTPSPFPYRLHSYINFISL